MKSKNALSAIRIIRILFLFFIALLLVYVYRLYTDGALLEQTLILTDYIINLLKKHTDLTILLSSYVIVFYLGYRIGKRR